MTEGLNEFEYLTWRVGQLHEKVDQLNQKVNEKEKQLLENQNSYLSELQRLLIKVDVKTNPEQELWDNWDIIQNWNVSARTLAEWRAKGIIGFVQVGNKIWYPRESRELFLQLHFNNPNDEEKRDGEEG